MKIAMDKRMHLAAGAVIAAVVGFAAALPLAGLAAGCLAGVAKEGYDRYQNRQAAKRGEPPAHAVESADIIATCIGAAAGAVFVYFALTYGVPTP